MKCVWHGVLLLVLAFAGVNAASAGQLKLNSGKSVELLNARETETPGGAALVLEYLTRISLDDITTLHKEADELWEKFVVEAERGKYKVAIISAHAPDKDDTATDRDPFDTVYEKINGAWRTRLRPADENVPFNEATIREIFDRQMWANSHDNMNAWRLFVADDLIFFQESPEIGSLRLTLDQYLALVAEVRAAADQHSRQYETTNITIDRKSGSARIEGRLFQSVTLNGSVIDTKSRIAGVMELRDGNLLWTQIHLVTDEVSEYRTN